MSDKLKLLIWGNTFPLVGGIERFVDNLAHGLVARGHDVVVISDGKRIETLSDRRFRVETVPMAEPILSKDASKILQSSQAIKRVINAFAPDVIHYNSSALELPLFAMSAMRTPYPVATTLHFDLSNPIFCAENGTFAKIVAASARITSVSKHVHSLVPEIRSLHGRHVDLIENTIPKAAPYRAPPDSKNILCLGRVIHEKGFDQIIAAMPAVLEKHPDAQLLVGGLGPERKNLQKQIEVAALGSNVALVGWIQPQNVNAKMQEANIVAFPSRWQEPFGLVAVEAAVAGRPCIAFDVGGIGESIETGVTGELVEPGNIPELANKICKLLSDPNRAKKQGLNAFKRHGAGAQFQQMLTQYETLFYNVKAENDHLSVE